MCFSIIYYLFMEKTTETRNYYLRVRGLEARVEARRKAEQKTSQSILNDGNNSAGETHAEHNMSSASSSLNRTVFEA